MSPRRVPQRSVVHWAVLGVLLAALLVAAATFDRDAWPEAVGDEATYLMQARSLAWDLDLTYSAGDFERYVRLEGMEPQGLILQKGRDGGDLVYGKPFFYALWAAPFVRVVPAHGPFLANAVLLILASLAAARALGRALGPVAPSWVALCVFGSVAFAHVFWVHLDLFLMCLAALGLSLCFAPARSARWRALARWSAAGALLAAVAYSRPLYATLLAPALLAAAGAFRDDGAGPERSAGRGVRWRAAGAFLAGALTLSVAALAVQESLAGSWTSYGAERRSFHARTGFPDIDFPASEWDAMIERWGNASWLKERALTGLRLGTPRLWGWNLVYFLAGRSIGLLPYMLPGALGILLWWLGSRSSPSERTRGPCESQGLRWALLGAFALTALGFFVLRPHNFYGGGGALANRYILPVYPALWFLPMRPVRAGWLALGALLAAPFLYPSWTAPGAYPLDEHRLFRYVAPAARALLPYETTQSHMKPTGPRVNVRHHGLWVKSLTPAIRAEGGGHILIFDPRLGPAEILVGDEQTLRAVHLEVRPARPDGSTGESGSGTAAESESGRSPGIQLDVEGARVAGETDLEGGGKRYWLELEDPRARHPMWWTREDFTLHLLRLEPRLEPTSGGADPLELTIRPADRAPAQPSSPTS